MQGDYELDTVYEKIDESKELHRKLQISIELNRVMGTKNEGYLLEPLPHSARDESGLRAVYPAGVRIEGEKEFRSVPTADMSEILLRAVMVDHSLTKLQLGKRAVLIKVLINDLIAKKEEESDGNE